MGAPSTPWGTVSPRGWHVCLRPVASPSQHVCLRLGGGRPYTIPKPIRMLALGLGRCVCLRPEGVTGVEEMDQKGEENRLRRLLIFYDPLQVVASELRRVSEILERLEISAEASVHMVSALRRVEEQLERINNLLENIYKVLEEGKTARKSRKRDGGQKKVEG